MTTTRRRQVLHLIQRGQLVSAYNVAFENGLSDMMQVVLSEANKKGADKFNHCDSTGRLRSIEFNTQK